MNYERNEYEKMKKNARIIYPWRWRDKTVVQNTGVMVSPAGWGLKMRRQDQCQGGGGKTSKNSAETLSFRIPFNNCISLQLAKKRPSPGKTCRLVRNSEEAPFRQLKPRGGVSLPD